MTCTSKMGRMLAVRSLEASVYSSNRMMVPMHETSAAGWPHRDHNEICWLRALHFIRTEDTVLYISAFCTAFVRSSEDTKAGVDVLRVVELRQRVQFIRPHV